MTLRVSPRTLEQIEWPLVQARLAALARTPGGRRFWTDAPPEALFVSDPDEIRERLAETTEARALLELGEHAPLDGVGEHHALLERARRGGTLGSRELLDLATAVETIGAAQRFFRRFPDTAPLLLDRAETLGDHGDLAQEIRTVLDPEGHVRDAASPDLAEARREARRLAGELQRRLTQTLQDPEVTPHLSDRFVTVRNDRYVIPVRADARPRVPGIVHDASASGTTLFVEPEAVVDLNNRLKEAELRVARETERLLRELSERVQRDADDLRASLEGLEQIDALWARGRLSVEWEGVAPEICERGGFELRELRHPLLPRDRVVPNDVRLGDSFHVLVLSGPNAGGKTVAMKAVALAALAAHAGLHVAAAPGARIARLETLLADIGDAQSLRESLSTFSAHMASLASIVRAAMSHSLVVLDEIGEGTDPGEGAALAQAVLEALADAGARVIATTHYNLLKELAAADPRFENASFEFDPATLAPTYRLRVGSPGVSSATAVAARMGMPGTVLERANALLDREDRRLERTLAELAESRLALEQERREAETLRHEAEADRQALREKIQRLQARRDRLFQSMRDDLERAFRSAHAEVASVIRNLQRGGTTAQRAAEARDRLLAVQARVEETAAAASEALPEPEPLDPLDWRTAAPGDGVRVAGGGSGVLVALPDRRGRVVVRVGGARLVVPADRVGAPRLREERRDPAPATRGPDPGPGGGGSSQCDLRGLRVDEALARVTEALDRAMLSGCRTVVLIHGLGTGALRDAVRRYLADSPYAAAFETAPPETGGDGATVVTLAG